MIEWAIKSKSQGGRCTADVSISNLKEHGKPILSVVLRNSSGNKITGTTYIQAGLDKAGGRIYFMSSDAKRGYKLTKKQNEEIRYFKFKCDWKDFVGDYSLEFNEKMNLWFIDSAHKK